MNKEIKAKWVAALRSGEYQQTTGALERTEEEAVRIEKYQGDVVPVGFCCLGVLCQLALKEGVIERVQDKLTKAVNYGTEGGGYSQASLPLAVQAWAGIGARHGFNPSIPYSAIPDSMKDAYDPDDPEIRPTLAAMNDRGIGFSEIADIIEEHF